MLMREVESFQAQTPKVRSLQYRVRDPGKRNRDVGRQ